MKAEGRTIGENKGVWVSLGFPGGTVVKKKKSTCQCKRHQRHGFNPWVRKILWRRNGNPLQCPCLGTPMDRGACWGPWGHRELALTEQSPAAVCHCWGNRGHRGFPDGPGVRTGHCHCRGMGSIPDQGTKIQWTVRQKKMFKYEKYRK